MESPLLKNLLSSLTKINYPSLNIASAVQIICYELMMATEGLEVPAKENEQNIAYVSSDEMERFYQHLEQTLVDIEFLRPDLSPQLMPKLRSMYNRLRLEQQELNILRGILSKTQRLTRK